MQLLKELNRLGTTVIVATHNDALVARHPGACAAARAWPAGARWLRRQALRPAGFDDLGLRRALGDRMLPLLVAAMAFLAALALAGSVAAAALARHWQEGAAAALTVQVPQPGVAASPSPGVAASPSPGATTPSSPAVAAATGGAQETRLDRVLSILRGTPGIAAARALGDGELADLLRPWLGGDVDRMSLPLPGVIEVHLSGDGPDLAALGTRLVAAAPGTLVESHGVWVQRLATLARSLQACALMALLVVAGVAAAVIAVATRAGLAARREAIEIVHGLGATDGYIAGRFAGRASTLAAAGGAVGAIAALPVLLMLATLAAPFLAAPTTDPLPAWTDGLPAAAITAITLIATLPAILWLALPSLPLVAGIIGFGTAQVTVRRWLRRLP